MGTFAVLVAGNAVVWAWALVIAAGNRPVLGMAVLAYTLGLRHAFDADHIVAIDNVTRSLAQRGSTPATVGLWFSLGHSTVVVVACIALVQSLSTAHDWLREAAAWGGLGGSLFSIAFLCVIAVVNIASMTALARVSGHRAAGRDVEVDPPRGLLAGLVIGPLRRVTTPRQMLFIGLLFGLGFDTASEVGLLALSAAAAANSYARWSIMALPALFTAGMTLADTADGALMARAYAWALKYPSRRATYNLTVTGISVAAALGIAALELGDLLRQQFSFDGGAWAIVEWVKVHSEVAGCVIAFVLFGCWGSARGASGLRR